MYKSRFNFQGENNNEISMDSHRKNNMDSHHYFAGANKEINNKDTHDYFTGDISMDSHRKNYMDSHHYFAGANKDINNEDTHDCFTGDISMDSHRKNNMDRHHHFAGINNQSANSSKVFEDTSKRNSASCESLCHANQSSAEQSGNESLGSFSTMMNFISEGLFAINRDGIIEMINPIAAKLFGQSRDELIGQSLLDYVIEEQICEYASLFDKLINHDNQIINHGPKEISLRRKDGSQRCADLSLSSLPESFITDRKLIIGVIHDLTSHKAEYGKLHRLARTDFLTNLANRHGFEETLNTQWVDCLNDELPLSLMVIDVDHFKQFNDQHGHVIGDKCLQRIAKTIQASLPSRDCLAARYGGEEFALVMPHCHSQIAQLVAIRLKRQIEELSFVDLGLEKDVQVTISIGIACQQQGLYKTAEALLSSADSALYRAKANGRNRICCI